MIDSFYALRRCLLEPIPEIFDAASMLEKAAKAHMQGNFSEAENLIKQADIGVIREWTETLWGRERYEIQRYRKIDSAPPTLSKKDKISDRMPSAQKRKALIERDGYHCRFCTIPVIDPSVRKAVHLKYPDALPWGRKNAEQHAAFQCMWLQYDHILPHSRGGDNALDNLAITCAPCNFGRMEYTLEELGLSNPLANPIIRSEWDGLQGLL